MGDAVVIVALALLVTDLTHNPTEVGIVLGAQMIPLVSFLLIAWSTPGPSSRAAAAEPRRRTSAQAILPYSFSRVARSVVGNTPDVMRRVS
jgi:hypothetical protein